MLKTLWLQNPKITEGLKRSEQATAAKAGISATFISPTMNHLEKKGKKYIADEMRRVEFCEEIRKHKPELIVCSDNAALGHITGNAYTSLAICRGSVLRHEGTPVVILDAFQKTKYDRKSAWIYNQDLRKTRRWHTGTQKPEPKFRFVVIRKIEQMQLLVNIAAQASFISIDIETAKRSLSCIGYSCVMPDRRILNFVVPLVICNEEGTEINSYWNQEDAERIWAALKHINLLPQPKCMQNGIYDNAYLINHRIPVDNWSLDTMHMWRCLWVELPKRLDFISSILLDNYKFWKDEGKEDERDDIKNTRLPTSLEGFESYWRYNALDIHNTSLDCIMLLQLLTHNKFTWALQNYLLEMQVQSGPCLTMSMRGTHCNLSLQRKFKTELTQDSNDARVVLHKMLGGNLPDFNPNSPTQVKWLIYDVLRAKPATKRAGRSTDQKFLALIQTQSWLLDTVIEQIWKVKKPANNASKYGDLWLPHNRLMYQISIATETERLASKAHQFWCGTNAQNIPKKMRVMLEPDPGYVLWDFDYAQSDAYFTAFTAQDKRFIATMLSDKDTHCLHAEQFFKKPYNELMAGHKIHADWVDHPTKGVRQNTKRIVYGANYMMRGQTLFITMGKHAVVATAQALGLTHADRWSDEKLVALCDKMLSAYFQLYPELAQWLKTQMKVIANEGSLATCCFGYTRYFFGDVLHDQETQRKVAAFYGQGGTAGNINKAMLNIQRELEPQGVELLMQIHDSIVGQVPLESLHLLSDVKRLMENTCKMHGTDFVVPVEGEVGLGWGNRLMAWTPGVTYDAIKKHDDAWWVDLNSNSKGAAA